MKEKLIIPNHLGIIMDGNGRWAQQRGMVRSFGHKEAITTLKELCNHMLDIGVHYCSLYAFSTENFKRDAKEVNFLMNLFVKTFREDFEVLCEKGIRVVFSGRSEPLPKEVLDAMDKLVRDTQKYDKLVINICLNYGSHAEMVDTTKKICEMYKDGKISLDDINEDFIQKNLYQDLPPLDFIIRTSGELRLSNFMMYQASYAEFYFPETYFPDFHNDEFDKAILEFNKRNRRFGGVK